VAAQQRYLFCLHDLPVEHRHDSLIPSCLACRLSSHVVQGFRARPQR